MDDADIARVRFIRYTPSHILARLLIASQFTHLRILWPPYGIGQTIIFLPCGFFLSFFFFSPNLSGRRSDVYHTSTHGVALVRISYYGRPM